MVETMDSAQLCPKPYEVLVLVFPGNPTLTKKENTMSDPQKVAKKVMFKTKGNQKDDSP